MDDAPTNHQLDKRVALLEQATKNIEKELHNISTNIMKLVWVVVTAVLVGLINLWLRFGSQFPAP